MQTIQTSRIPGPLRIAAARKSQCPPVTGGENFALEGKCPDKMVRDLTQKLLNYCRSNNWAGYDPYDALNSKVFKAIPFLNFRFARLAFTQAMKRSPLNFRKVLGVRKSGNPKGLALFLTALLKLSRQGQPDCTDIIRCLADKLVGSHSACRPEWCWGYNFEWQARTGLVPNGYPNIICTTFAANALLDFYEKTGDPQFLAKAASAAGFIHQFLYRDSGNSSGYFSYTELEQSPVHNANLLGAAFLCRAFRKTGEKIWLHTALKAARFTANRQQGNGSWTYGELPTQQWIDNFHTGFNLCALRSIGRDTATSEFETVVRNGYRFYRNHFFDHGSVPKYFHNRTYPVDAHSVAQSIITLVEFNDLDPEAIQLAHAVLVWAKRHLWDERGFFYYQKHRYLTNRIPYMRWSQAWMLLALSTLPDHRPSLQFNCDP